MRKTYTRVLPLATTAYLLLASPALAKNGEGLYGEASDLVVTNFGMGLVVFFVALVCILTVIQTRRERQKEARQERFNPDAR